MLPVELFHDGPDEMPPPFRSALLERFSSSSSSSTTTTTRLEVKDLDSLIRRRLSTASLEHDEGALRDLLGFGPDRGGSSKYHLKPFAVLHSKFREVLFLDADVVVARDVACLFSSTAYLDGSAALFWKDLSFSESLHDAANPIYRLLNLAKDSPDQDSAIASMQAQDSAILLVDKGAALEPLLVCAWLNGDHYSSRVRTGRRRGLAPLVRTFLDGGDKETWHLGWRTWAAFLAQQATNVQTERVALGAAAFHFEHAQPAVVAADHAASARFCGSTFLHWWTDQGSGGSDDGEGSTKGGRASSGGELESNSSAIATAVATTAADAAAAIPLLLHSTLAKRGPIKDYARKWLSVKGATPPPGKSLSAMWPDAAPSGDGASPPELVMRRPSHTSPLTSGHDTAEDCRWAMDLFDAHENQGSGAVPVPAIPFGDVLGPSFESFVIEDLKDLHGRLELLRLGQ